MAESHELEVVYETRSAEEADIIRLALENQGFFCALENAHQASYSGVFPIKVFVRAEDAHAARKYLQQQGTRDPRQTDLDLDDDPQ